MEIWNDFINNQSEYDFNKSHANVPTQTNTQKDPYKMGLTIEITIIKSSRTSTDSTTELGLQVSAKIINGLPGISLYVLQQ